MKYILILILIYFWQLSSFAQSNYKPGFLVTTAGDTVKGFIDYKEWNINPKSFSFVTDIQAKEAQKFSPATSKYFEITGMTAYEMYNGRMSMYQTQLDNISTIVDTATINATVFLKVEQRGRNVTLLSYKDVIKSRCFLRENNSNQAQELIFKTILTHNNQLASSNMYRNQLWLAAVKYKVGSDNLKRTIENTAYSLADIRTITNKINSIDREKIKQTKSNNAKCRFIAGIALNRSTIDVIGDYLVSQASEASYLPKLSAGIDVFLNPDIQKWVFRTELSATKLRVKNVSVTIDETSRTRKFTQTLDNRIITLSPQIIYNLYNSNNLKFYLGAGIAANSASIQTSENVTTYAYPSGEINEREENYILQLIKLNYALPIRIGIVLNNKLEGSVIYILPSPMADFHSFAFRSSSVQVGINYLLNLNKK